MSKKLLFTEGFPPFTTNFELTRIQEAHKELDPYYIATAMIEERREGFDEMWNLFQDFSDSDWENRARQSFISFSWEVFVGSLFISNGFSLDPHRDIGPDAILKGLSTYIECTITDKGHEKSLDRVTELRDGLVANIPVEKIILRIAQAISNKALQYNSWKKNSWFDPKAPYILAINLADLRQVTELYGMPIVVSAAFGVGDPSIHRVTREATWTNRTTIEKANKSLIGSAFFLEPENAFISGILCTGRHIIDDEIISDISYVENPLASNPFDIELLKFTKRWKIDEKGQLVRL